MNPDVIAYFITWTCYGSFLPGDDRGWTKWHSGDRVPEPKLAEWCEKQMIETPIILDRVQREIVQQVILDHCEHRDWTLHAANCRTNHCHVVVTAMNHSGDQVRDQLKSWATRRLKEASKSKVPLRQHWWTRKGSVRKLFDEDSVDAAVRYTLEAQDKGGTSAYD